MKRIFTLMISILSIFAFTLVVNAASQTIYLKGSGSNFNGSNWNNVFKMTTEVGSDPSVWHLVYTGDNVGLITGMQLTFTNGEVFTWTPSMGFSTNQGGNNPGWVIVAPYDWQIAYVNSGNNNVSGSYVTTNEAGNINFNISGYHKGTPGERFGSLQVAVDAKLTYDKVTYQPIWQKVVLPTWQKELQPVWQKTVLPIWQKEIQPVWQKTLQPVWQKEIRPVYVPRYAKEVSEHKGTLVTRLDYNNNTASAKPTNGGTFGNGMTWLKVDLKNMPSTGYTYPIADSSYNANGKKTPSEYNNPIGYSYTVKQEGNNLVISFNDQLISASISAKVYSAAPDKHDPSGHKTISAGGSLIIPLPTATNAAKVTPKVTTTQNGNLVTVYVTVGTDTYSGIVDYVKNGKTTASFDGCVVDLEFNGNGVKSATLKSNPEPIATPQVLETVYLFVHLEAIKWFTTGEYKFVDYVWKKDKVEADYLLRKDEVSDVWKKDKVKSDELLREDVTKDEWLRDDVAKDAWLKDKVVADRWLRNDVVADSFVEDKEVADFFVRNREIARETVTEDITSEVVLTCYLGDSTTPAFTRNFLAKTGPVINNLTPGVYNCVISESGIAPRSAQILVEADKVASHTFTGITVVGENEINYTSPEYLKNRVLPKVYLKPIVLDKVYTDPIILDKEYAGNIVLDKIYTNPIILDKVYTDPIVSDKVYAKSIILDKIYDPDITLDAKYLGKRHAIYLN